jgi:hypothetical protein
MLSQSHHIPIHDFGVYSFVLRIAAGVSASVNIHAVEYWPGSPNITCRQHSDKNSERKKLDDIEIVDSG